MWSRSVASPVRRHFEVMLEDTSTMLEQTPIDWYVPNVQLPVGQLPETFDGLAPLLTKPSVIAPMTGSGGDLGYSTNLGPETAQCQNICRIHRVVVKQCKLIDSLAMS